MDCISSLCSDLEIDVKKVEDLVSQFGLYDAARILGYDVSHYHNLAMAGRLAILHQRNKAPKSLLEYSEVMKEYLHPKIFSFIINHHRELQYAIDKNSHLDFDHDWFSAN